MLIRGCDAIASVMRDEKRSRSTASAAPAGTRVSSAARITSEPSRRISSFKRPTALSSLSPRKELLQTSSARRSVLWTAVGWSGRISYSVTDLPSDAACQAASEPARPPPMIRIMALSVLRSRRGVWKHLGPRVIAVFVVAQNLPAVLLGGLLEDERCTAFRARLVDGAVPQHEVAVRVVGAPEEDFTALGFPLDDLAALVGVLRTLHARGPVLDVPARSEERRVGK